MTKSVTVRDLRNRGGTILDETARSGPVVVTRDGVPVAELRPLPSAPLTADELIRRRRSLPVIDVERLRSEIDEVLDPSL